MPILLSLFTLLTGLTLVILPLSPSFFPNLGLGPLKLGHHRLTRLALVSWLWLLVSFQFLRENSTWSWVSLAIAGWFSLVALNFYPQRIFVALDRPEHASTDLAGDAPVLAVEIENEVSAYPLETLVPHHIINDTVAGKPILVAW